MECENFFCIYQEDGKCTLKKISVGIIGQCEDCMYVDIDYEHLKELKQKHLKKISEYKYT